MSTRNHHALEEQSLIAISRPPWWEKRSSALVALRGRPGRLSAPSSRRVSLVFSTDPDEGILGDASREQPCEGARLLG